MVKSKPFSEPQVVAADPSKAARSRNREKTRQELQCAMLRVKNKGAGMNISAVAREAGVNASLLHNTYPDIAEEIRTQMGRSTRDQRDQKAADLARARKIIRELRSEIKEMNANIAKIASVNLNLENEVTLLRAAVKGKVVILSDRKCDLTD